MKDIIVADDLWLVYDSRSTDFFIYLFLLASWMMSHGKLKMTDL